MNVQNKPSCLMLLTLFKFIRGSYCFLYGNRFVNHMLWSLGKYNLTCCITFSSTDLPMPTCFIKTREIKPATGKHSPGIYFHNYSQIAKSSIIYQHKQQQYTQQYKFTPIACPPPNTSSCPELPRCTQSFI